MADIDVHGAWSIWTLGAWLAGFMKGLLNIATYKILKLGTLCFRRRFFYAFPIVSLWELSVAIETTILIQSAPKPNAVNPLTQ